MRQILNRLSIAAAVAALILAPTAALARQQAADLIIRDARVVDVATGEITPGRSVVIRGGDIVAVEPDAEAARGYVAGHVFDA